MLKIMKRYFNRTFLIVTIVIIVSFIVGFLLLKEQYYYEIVERFYDYPMQIVNRYYHNDISKLILDGLLMLYKEPGLNKIFSSIYLYFATFSTVIFQIMKVIIPVIIFYLVYKVIGMDIYNRIYPSIIFRIGRLKYFLGHMLGASLVGGLICIIPKVIYYLILRVFFVGGYSLDFIVENYNFVAEPYLLSSFLENPWMVFMKDLGISFLYGVALALIAMCVIMIVRSKYISVIIYILLILAQCVFASVLIGFEQMIINCYSMIDFTMSHPEAGAILLPMLSMIIVFTILLSFILCYRKMRYEV